jgi:hypothetical protein
VAVTSGRGLQFPSGGLSDPNTAYSSYTLLPALLAAPSRAPDRAASPGVGWPEDKSTTHWLENRGTTPAVEISVDIVRQP